MLSPQTWHGHRHRQRGAEVNVNVSARRGIDKDASTGKPESTSTAGGYAVLGGHKDKGGGNAEVAVDVDVDGSDHGSNNAASDDE